ncbi:MAG: IclR family transcriptional regulator [Devosia sp.]
MVRRSALTFSSMAGQRGASKAPDKDTSTVQSISRAAQVLDAVAEHSVSGAGLPTLVAATGLNRATCHRILKSLVETGLVDQDPATTHYFPGIKLVEIAATASNRYGLARQSQDGRARIAERTADTVFLTLRVGREAVCVARTEGAFPIKTLTLNVGDTRPLGVGAGSLAILAFLGEEERNELLHDGVDAFTRYGASRDELAEDAARAATLGYALDEGRIIPGITGIGVPLRGGRGDVVAALSVAAISSRLTGARRTNVVTWLLEEAGRLERELAPILSTRAAAGRTLILGGTSS